MDEGLKMYSRWGNIVCVLNGEINRWYGQNMQGKDLAVGTYFYIFTGETKEGKTISKKGNISLFR